MSAVPQTGQGLGGAARPPGTSTPLTMPLTVADVLAHYERRGAVLYLGEGGRLRVDAPRGELGTADRAFLAEHREALTEALRERADIQAEESLLPGPGADAKASRPGKTREDMKGIPPTDEPHAPAAIGSCATSSARRLTAEQNIGRGQSAGLTAHRCVTSCLHKHGLEKYG
jgi:hypothetical protein